MRPVTLKSSVPPLGTSEYARSDHGIVGTAAAMVIRSRLRGLFQRT